MSENKNRITLLFCIAVLGAIFSGSVILGNDRYYSKYEVESVLSDEKETVVRAEDDITVTEEKSDTASNEKNDLYININTDDISELEKLKGIGEKIAQRIIDYRKENGNFEVIEDIMKVSGIGKKRFQDIKDYIYVK